jgi:hypothetical protein
VASELHLLINQVAGVAQQRDLGRTIAYGGKKKETGGSEDDDDDDDDDHYTSDFEEGEETVTRPAAQLLGMTQGPVSGGLDRTQGGGKLQLPSSGSVTLRAALIDGGGRGGSGGSGGMDELMLSAGLPKAGFGFGGSPVTTPKLRAAAATVAAAADGDAKSGEGRRLEPAITSPTRASFSRLAPLASGAPMALPSVPPLKKPASFAFPSPVGGGGGGSGGAGASPDSGKTAVEGGWKLSTAARRRAEAAPGSELVSATIGQLSLNEALTNRAAFLRGELMLQLGGEDRLKAACEAVRMLHASKAGAGGGGGSCGLGDGALREALCGVVSPAHLELAPLLDELVLLQERFFLA